MLSATDAIDIRDGGGFVPAIPGTGTADHVALRVADAAALDAAASDLRAAGTDFTPPKDRTYFQSLYLREPGGVLIELATDGPGMTIDEPAATLGTRLMIPPRAAERAEDLRVMLPQFALPGEDRFPMRQLSFTHRIHRPDEADGSVIVHLHGTGGNEADLMPLAHRLNPRATLLGVRGRSTEEGVARWFRRLDMARFDQADIRAEAEAFAAFMAEASRHYALDPARMTWLGYSNGANFIGAVMGLHPGLVRRAILIRAMPALDPLPAADLSAAAVLMLTGTRDPYARFAPPLEAWLRAGGAALDARQIAAGHALSPADLEAAQSWLAGAP
jgi:phospholipase/carboxylesterase